MFNVQELCVRSRRTTADQEVLALIAPLAKLGHFEVAADFFQAYVLQLAYRVGNTSWLSIVLLATTNKGSLFEWNDPVPVLLEPGWINECLSAFSAHVSLDLLVRPNMTVQVTFQLERLKPGKRNIISGLANLMGPFKEYVTLFVTFLTHPLSHVTFSFTKQLV